jgi:hypothetical protein
MAGSRWRGFPPRCPESSGEGPGKTDSLYHNNRSRQQERRLRSVLRTATCGHLAETELTSMVSPFKTPVTVTFFPACLSKAARAAWSVVSKI